MDNGLIRLTLTPMEGVLVGVFLQAALEQYNSATPEEQADADHTRMADMCRRLIPLLPRIPDGLSG